MAAHSPVAPVAAAGATVGRLVLWLPNSVETGEHSHAPLAPYFPIATVVRLSFPTAPVACYDEVVLNA
ncbi:hypothetical protein ZWY2020_059443 [Hordeum vulgare]|nr:hypothetical protein ZWY2020_011801 [Hordeum vulgare]KAI5015904.1 hypothetical protein ZWY2020_059443 [Hordeum vulgare]